jgi:hypothetical protein
MECGLWRRKFAVVQKPTGLLILVLASSIIGNVASIGDEPITISVNDISCFLAAIFGATMKNNSTIKISSLISTAGLVLGLSTDAVARIQTLAMLLRRNRNAERALGIPMPK